MGRRRLVREARGPSGVVQLVTARGDAFGREPGSVVRSAAAATAATFAGAALAVVAAAAAQDEAAGSGRRVSPSGQAERGRQGDRGRCAERGTAGQRGGRRPRPGRAPVLLLHHPSLVPMYRVRLITRAAAPALTPHPRLSLAASGAAGERGEGGDEHLPLTRGPIQRTHRRSTALSTAPTGRRRTARPGAIRRRLGGSAALAEPAVAGAALPVGAAAPAAAEAARPDFGSPRSGERRDRGRRAGDRPPDEPSPIRQPGDPLSRSRIGPQRAHARFLLVTGKEGNGPDRRCRRPGQAAHSAWRTPGASPPTAG